MKRYLPWLIAAASLVAAGTLAVAPGGEATAGSSPERTAYSAVFALKHKNFGKFCSYLDQNLRGDQYACATNNAAGWGQNAVFFGLDIFGPEMHVLDNYRVDVDESTVSFVVMLTMSSGLQGTSDNPYYRFTVSRQDNGKWRISKIEGNVNLVDEAYAAKASRE